MAPKTQDRANQILHLLLQKGQSCVEDLAVTIDASPASVRRDLIKLEQRGLVFASGPLADGEGPPSGHGLTVLRAKSTAEARALAEADPFFINGLRTFELKEWTIMEGTLGLSVNLSDQSIEVT